MFTAWAGAWEFDKAYRLPNLPLLAQRASADTAFYFYGEKSGSPKTYARTSILCGSVGSGR
ncbi:MAG: hypothetical protein IPN71_16935 [Fibrobacteres bacterium]|nr:hypothetical protein [Fibrobacterota bacterium]